MSGRPAELRLRLLMLNLLSIRRVWDICRGAQAGSGWVTFARFVPYPEEAHPATPAESDSATRGLPARMAEIDRRFSALEARVALLSKALGMASLREVDLLKRLSLSTEAIERDSEELRALMDDIDEPS